MLAGVPMLISGIWFLARHRLGQMEGRIEFLEAENDRQADKVAKLEGALMERREGR